MRKVKIPFEKCPKCGSEDGFYTKEQARGPIRYKYNFDGSESDNGEMYEGLSFFGGNYAYCIACDKRIFKVEYENSFYD